MNSFPQPVDAKTNIQRFAVLMHTAQRFYNANPNNTPQNYMDISSEDIQHLMKSLNTHHVQYLLVGGMAGIVHGHSRTTQDLDLWIKSTPENQQNLVAALLENDVAGAEYLLDNPLIFGRTSVRFGSAGFELDLGHWLKFFTEDDFDACYERALIANLDGIDFKVLNINDLILEKKATGRFKDLADVEELEKKLTNKHQ